MKSHTSIFAGPPPAYSPSVRSRGWMAPNVLRSAHAESVSSAVPLPRHRPPNSTSAPVPLGTAPNYRAIVAQNRAAVVGITTAGEMNVASDQPPGGIPFGDLWQ